MNTHNFKLTLYSALAIILLVNCTKEKQVTFGVKETAVYDDKSKKTKNKSEAEYISILYTNLYQTPISPTQLYKTQTVLVSIGDRNVANEMLLSNYFNTGTLQIPTNTEMRADLSAFIENTYKRFFLRNPTEGEKVFFKNYINANPSISVEMVYTAFATADEYQYY